MAVNPSHRSVKCSQCGLPAMMHGIVSRFQAHPFRFPNLMPWKYAK